MLRSAIIDHTDDVKRVSAYLPSNYKCALVTFDNQHHILISGTDVAGWTLDGYVIPRLASGMIFAQEVVS